MTPRDVSSHQSATPLPKQSRRSLKHKSAPQKFRLGRKLNTRRTVLRPEPQPEPPATARLLAQAPHSNPDVDVSWRLRVSAAWAWRLIVVVVAAAGILWGISKIKIAMVPLAIAVLLTLLFEPLNARLQKWRLSPTLSAALSLIIGIVVLSAAVWVSVSQLASGAPKLIKKASGGFNKLLEWFNSGPLGLDPDDFAHYARRLGGQLEGLAQQYFSSIASSAWSVTSSVLNLVATLFISLFCLFFFLKDGQRIWEWFMGLLPVDLRQPVHEAGIRGWRTLRGYIKAQAMVAGVDAVFISIGAAILGAGSMTIPLALLIFLASFIPIVGAVSTGVIAVLVILLDQGLVKAVIMLVVILAVQQIESNILQPMLMSTAVNIHPLAVLLAITVGGYLAGIMGALIAVPIVAFVNTVALYLTGSAAPRRATTSAAAKS